MSSMYYTTLYHVPTHFAVLILVLFALYCMCSAVRNWQAVVVLVAPGPLSRLIDIYFDTLEATAIKQIER